MVMLGSVTMGSPWTCPTTCWELTSVSRPAALNAPLAVGINRGRFCSSSKVRSQLKRLGCMTTTVGGRNLVLLIVWMALASAE